MKTSLFPLWQLLTATLFTLLLNISPLLAQTFQNYAPSVCPNQTVTYMLENIPADYKIENPSIANGAFRNTPTVVKGRAEYQVVWGVGETGSIMPGLRMPTQRDRDGNITAYGPATPSNTPSVVVKSVFGRRILAQINNTASLEL
ncbi:hypothetical protein ACFSX6_01610, partial [Hymenobacter rubripertinctus]|uniref:hypothetical protein n=1 Tax=Hymenobacter rubripertinctus TaxID=2029981 RepID=UPI00362ED94B